MPSWKQYRDLPYSVSDWGTVRDDRTGKILHISTNAQNVDYVKLNLSNRRIVRSLAIMVGEVWRETENPAFTSIIHLDGNKANCLPHNLRWRPRMMALEYHRQFRIKFDWTVERPFVELTENVALSFASLEEARVTFGVLDRTVAMNLTENSLLKLRGRGPQPSAPTEHIFVYL